MRFLWNGRPHLGICSDDGDGIHDLTEALSVSGNRSAGIALEARRALEAGDLTAWIRSTGMTGPDSRVEELRLSSPIRPWDRVKLLPPIPNPPKNIMCIGRNFKAHALESARFRGQPPKLPEHPVIFTKPPTAIIGCGDDIRYDPGVTQQLDYEGEVAVVIGREGRDISPDEAYDYVFGYTLMNDVTARDLQGRHQQFFKGKGLDTFAPLGPIVVERGEIPDPATLELKTYVNGELRQHARLADLIFDIPTLISVISAGMTLQPGDIIATGTPEGVGAGFEPPRFLQDGDVVEIVAGPLGTLRNRVKIVH